MSLKEMLPIASARCAKGHEMFVNHAGFFPDLRPSDYAPLVRQVSEFVRRACVRVNDGQRFLGRIQSRDTMHFAKESFRAVVEMLSEVIEDLDAERVTKEEFDHFSFTWRAVESLLRERTLKQVMKSTGAPL